MFCIKATLMGFCHSWKPLTKQYVNVKIVSLGGSSKTEVSTGYWGSTGENPLNQPRWSNKNFQSKKHCIAPYITRRIWTNAWDGWTEWRGEGKRKNHVKIKKCKVDTKGINQGQANCNPQAKSGSQSLFVNKVLLTHIILHIVHGCFHTTVAELTSWPETAWGQIQMNNYLD